MQQRSQRRSQGCCCTSSQATACVQLLRAPGELCQGSDCTRKQQQIVPAFMAQTAIATNCTYQTNQIQCMLCLFCFASALTVMRSVADRQQRATALKAGTAAACKRQGHSAACSSHAEPAKVLPAHAHTRKQHCLRTTLASIAAKLHNSTYVSTDKP